MLKLLSRSSHLACAAVLLLSAAPVMAQTAQATGQVTTQVSTVAMAGTPVRVIPDDAQMARLELARPSASEPLQAKLDGKVHGVAPGLRIFSTDTMLMNPNVVAGKKLNVRYKLDLYGQLLTAWVLTDAEVKAWKAAH
ncbi:MULTISPECIES: hypothetical protein [unclassified Cupriavidus]|uniref:hypothetical protein n=1 Tax=unclassified Cupriavidus TaxID=2640874 RepID=UPI001C007EC8|nr:MULTISPECIES: hypothetical protein [unclassified Cupriavidus]MCA3185850.1 hypothetical protein [Cupriavidus sp.]MCA3190250.1 hypothetical protein [Cupriavidus sp.]MCA3196954.1 hypothetical protein [Cupriavidus sp.]MCA3202231.1 hypothetical protein [Cupriavidus sp.]MCA3208197.1 hypothetical protein [Cupriavidus sp.]